MTKEERKAINMVDTFNVELKAGISYFKACSNLTLKITQALKEQSEMIEEMKSALEFYASTSRWESTTHESTRDGIGCTDFQTFKCGLEGPIQFGGKTARSTLAKYKERLEK